jgi:hypothetical protein
MRNRVSDVRRAPAFVVAGFMVSVAMAQDTGSHRVKAMLVSQESSLHTSVSNRDVYRLRIMPRKEAAFEAVAINSYPSYAEALPLRSFVKNTNFSIKLVRTPYCDRKVADDMEGAIIRCFAMERDSWKAPKSAVIDVWWR